MATTTIREFLVSLGWSVDEAGMAKFTRAITLSTAGATALGVAVVAAAGAVLGAVKSIAEDYDKLDKLATRFRSTADAVDEFADVGGLLGLSNEQTIGSLTALDRAIGDTALGLGRAKKVFEEIGVQVLDASGKMRGTVDVMNELGTVLGKMERGKAIAVMERLGLDPALVKVFNADLVALRADLAAIDDAAGFDLSVAVASSKAFMKSWRALQLEISKARLVFSKMYEAIGVRLMPRLSAAVDEMTRRIAEARKYIMENLSQLQSFIAGTIDVVLRLFGFAWALFGRVADAVVGFVQLIIGAFRSLDPTLQLIIGGALALAAAWRLVNLAFLASPVTWVLALGVALLALLDEYMTWKEGGESLIDWGKWADEVAIVTAIVQGFADTLGSIFTAIFTLVDYLAHMLRGDFVGAWRLVGESVNAVIDIFRNAFDWITRVVDAVAKVAGMSGSLTGAIGGMIGRGLDAVGGSAFASAPLPATVLSPEGNGAAPVSINQTTTIQVQGGDAAATGRAVAGEQDRVNADQVRNLRGATR